MVSIQTSPKYFELKLHLFIILNQRFLMYNRLVLRRAAHQEYSKDNYEEDQPQQLDARRSRVRGRVPDFRHCGLLGFF